MINSMSSDFGAGARKKDYDKDGQRVYDGVKHAESIDDLLTIDKKEARRAKIAAKLKEMEQRTEGNSDDRSGDSD